MKVDGALNKTPLPVTLGDVQAAARVLDGAIKRTSFEQSRTLSEIIGAKVWLKFENLQFTASFKDRGALNRLSALTSEERKLGVVAASAGNHAQGVAYHACRLGVPATIFVPVGTATVKIENTRRYGAEVIIAGENVEGAATAALAYGREHNLAFIHPYDDALVIAGQGTTALEMLSDVPALDVLVVPVGGGGLISGIAVAAKAIKPSIEIIGVQASLYPSMYNVVTGAKEPVCGDTLADGIAVKAPGQLTSKIIRTLVDEIVLVSESQIEAAVSALIALEKSVTEGAGAAGLAAVLAGSKRFAGQNVGIVLSGGNIDARLLSAVLTRQLAQEGRLSKLRVDVVDRPGQLERVVSILSAMGGNIVEVCHQRVFTDLPAKAVMLEIVLETRDRDHRDATIRALRTSGISVDAGEGVARQVLAQG